MLASAAGELHRRHLYRLGRVTTAVSYYLVAQPESQRLPIPLPPKATACSKHATRPRPALSCTHLADTNGEAHQRSVLLHRLQYWTVNEASTGLRRRLRICLRCPPCALDSRLLPRHLHWGPSLRLPCSQLGMNKRCYFISIIINVHLQKVESTSSSCISLKDMLSVMPKMIYSAR